MKWNLTELGCLHWVSVSAESTVIFRYAPSSPATSKLICKLLFCFMFARCYLNICLHGNTWAGWICSRDLPFLSTEKADLLQCSRSPGISKPAGKWTHCSTLVIHQSHNYVEHSTQREEGLMTVMDDKLENQHCSIIQRRSRFSLPYTINQWKRFYIISTYFLPATFVLSLLYCLLFTS